MNYYYIHQCKHCDTPDITTLKTEFFKQYPPVCRLKSETLEKTFEMREKERDRREWDFREFMERRCEDNMAFFAAAMKNPAPGIVKKLAGLQNKMPFTSGVTIRMRSYEEEKV
jgi:hypothetical protein